MVVKNTIWHVIKRSEGKMKFGEYAIAFDTVLQCGARGAKVKLKGPVSKEQKKQGMHFTDGGRLYITAFPDNPNQGRFRMDARASGVPKPMIGSVESFLEFTVPSERNRLLYRSEVAKGANPAFRNFEITQGKLPDFETEIALACYEYKEDGRIKFTRDNKISYKCFGKKAFVPKDLFDIGQRGLRLTDKLNVMLCNIVELPSTFASYTDFIQAGLQLKFTLALDFTEGSFVDHQNEETLPYFNAIQAFGGIMGNFDDDQKVPCLGFDENGVFELGSEQEEHLDDLLVIYRDEVTKHPFEEGEVKLTPLISRITEAARLDFTANQEAREYHILVVLSSGSMDDLEDVVNQLTSNQKGTSQNVPISVIFIGIGANQFYAFDSLMEKIQSKDKATRPLVTYVNTRDIPLPNYEALQQDAGEDEFYDEFADSDSDGSLPPPAALDMAEVLKYKLQYQNLAEKVMEDIPQQVETFYKLRNVAPLRRGMRIMRTETFNKPSKI